MYSFAIDHNTDTEAPTIICPTNQTIETDLTQSSAVVVWTAPVAFDNSKLIPTVTCNKQNGSQFEIGETVVMCQALDQAGNQATCSFIVDVAGKCNKIHVRMKMFRMEKCPNTSFYGKAGLVARYLTSGAQDPRINTRLGHSRLD